MHPSPKMGWRSSPAASLLLKRFQPCARYCADGGGILQRGWTLHVCAKHLARFGRLVVDRARNPLISATADRFAGRPSCHADGKMRSEREVGQASSAACIVRLCEVKKTFNGEGDEGASWLVGSGSKHNVFRVIHPIARKVPAPI